VPSLAPFHAQIALGEDEVEVMQLAIRSDGRLRAVVEDVEDTDFAEEAEDDGIAGADGSVIAPVLPHSPAASAPLDLLHERTYLEERLTLERAEMLSLQARIAAHSAPANLIGMDEFAELTGRSNLLVQSVQKNYARLAEIGSAIVEASRENLLSRLPAPAVELLLRNWPVEGQVWSDLYAALGLAHESMLAHGSETNRGAVEKRQPVAPIEPTELSEDESDPADQLDLPPSGDTLVHAMTSGISESLAAVQSSGSFDLNTADVKSSVTDIDASSMSSKLADLQVSLGSRLAPEKRGGRPRGSRSGAAEEAEHSDEDLPPYIDRPRVRLELRRVASYWDLILVVNVDASIDVDSVAARQDDRSLECIADGVFRLDELTDVEVTVAGEIQRTLQMPWIERDLLAFCLRGGDTARIATRITHDVFALLVPLGWKPQRAEFMEAYEFESLVGYKLVFLDLTDAGDVIMFDATEGEKTIFIGDGGFRCEGACIIDDDADLPPIYGPRFPDLIADSAAAWQRIDTIVLVEEGDVGDRPRRRASWHPNPTLVLQTIKELPAFKSGWFSARLYDAFDNLVKVMSFRFVSGLKVTSSLPTPLPVDGRQTSARILMQWNFGISVLVRPPDALASSVKTYGVGIEAVLPLDDAQFDVTTWQLVIDGRAPLTLNLRVPRVWWSFDESQWNCVEISLTRADFRASAGRALRLKMPQGADARIGFDAEQSFVVRSEPGSDERTVPLRLLGAQPIVAARSEAADLMLWTAGGQVRIARLLREDGVQTRDELAAPLPSESTVFDMSSTLGAAQSTGSVVRDEVVRETKILSEKIIDYRHLADVAGDEAFKWYVLQCKPYREEQCVKMLSDLVAGAGLRRDVPVIVFPVKKVRKELKVGSYVKERIDTEPAIEREYFFVVRRPEVSISKLIAQSSARELETPISSEWLGEVLRFKQESQVSVRTQIMKGVRVLFTGDVLTGAVGEVLDVNNARRTAKVGVELTERIVPTEISLDLITPA
jgi:transcription antitermination factor NusG